MALLLGITGGIGSGKSTIAQGLSHFGYEVFFTDVEAKYLMETNPCVKSQIELLFGSDIYGENDKLDRKRISDIVFADKQVLEKMNEIVHPAVLFEVEHWSRHIEADFCFVESAILFESGLDRLCKGVIAVTADEETRIERAMKRDSATREAIEARISQQMSQQELVKRADLVLINDGKTEVGDLCLQVQDFCRNFAGHNDNRS